MYVHASVCVSACMCASGGAEIEKEKSKRERKGGAYAIPGKQPVIPGIPKGPKCRLRRLDANLRPGNRPTCRCLTIRRGVTSKH